MKGRGSLAAGCKVVGVYLSVRRRLRRAARIVDGNERPIRS